MDFWEKKVYKLCLLYFDESALQGHHRVQLQLICLIHQSLIKECHIHFMHLYQKGQLRKNKWKKLWKSTKTIIKSICQVPLLDRVSTATLANAMMAIAISQWHLPPKLPLWQRMAFATMAETYNSHCVQTACSFSSRHSGNCHSGMCHIFPRWHNLPVYTIY